MLTESAELKLIDNEMALGFGEGFCSLDSLFIPATQKHTILRLGNEFVGKVWHSWPGDRPRPNPKFSLEALLDYRWVCEGDSAIPVLISDSYTFA